MTVWWLLLGVIIVSWGLTLLLRRYALAKSLIDIPNERSSHSVPTPRGGGLAIVAAFLLALPVLSGLGLLDIASLIALLGSGLLVAVIGFADDHGHIAAKWRLLGHFVAAAWALYWLNGLPPIEFFGVTFDLGWFGNILALVYLVWMLNLYNFMDGVDGLASVEAVSVCLGMCLVCWLGGSIEIIWAPLALAIAVSGFLFWNFPIAKIFMGDAGSGFLGVIIGIFAILSSFNKPELLWSWLILLGVFIVDSTITLLIRLIAGAKIYEAHSSHAYQCAARKYSSHVVVTVFVLFVNLIWLLPISIFVGLGVVSGVVGMLIAYIPLCIVVFYVKL